MGLFSKDIKTLGDLFVHQLEDIHYAEQQMINALPDMIDKATDGSLRSTLENHLQETNGQIQRLEKVFQMHGATPRGTNCPAIDGIIEEADDVSSDVEDKQVLDAAILANAQAVEHYEITRYGTRIAWAKQRGRADCADVLQQNLDEEKAADRKLASVAEAHVNRAA
jgi:ferritin-like metal-binding protein YciE